MSRPPCPARARWSTGIASGCLVVAGLVLGACRQEEAEPMDPTVPPSSAVAGASSVASAELGDALRRAAERRVLFAHQSVGANLLEGLGELLAESGTRWVVATAEAAPAGAALIDATPGSNGDPRSKMEAFAALVRASRPPPQLALMKLCFLDVTDQTDVDAVFSHYERTLEQLQRELPQVVFGHVTVPLSVRPETGKARLYRLVGRRVWEDASNARRAEYNARLRERFAAAPLFDLAVVESTRPDGSREQHEVRGSLVPALSPLYASDSVGHLNAHGGRVAAAAFVRFVAATSPRE